MSSPGQKHGVCGHLMASFDNRSFCARSREKGKGSDPCVSHNDCNSCNILTEEQHLQLATPSYRLKKEKRGVKKSSDTSKKKDSDSSSLIDPSSVTVAGALDNQGMLQSPGSSSSTDKKKKKTNPTDNSKGHTSKPTKSEVC